MTYDVPSSRTFTVSAEAKMSRYQSSLAEAYSSAWLPCAKQGRANRPAVGR